jgi:hypothetical protein
LAVVQTGRLDGFRRSRQWRPIFFKVLGYRQIPKPIVGRSCVALQFEQQELANPEGDLVGIAFWAGRRRYLWADKWWSEYPLESRVVIERLQKLMSKAPDKEFDDLIDILEWVHRYQKSPPPETEYKSLKDRRNEVKGMGFFKSCPPILQSAILNMLKEDTPRSSPVLYIRWPKISIPWYAEVDKIALFGDNYETFIHSGFCRASIERYSHRPRIRRAKKFCSCY